MSYSAAIDQLNRMTPELYTQPGGARRKFSLDEIRVLLEALGNPQRRFKSVLIAGTNGKGSTAATLASILHSAGARSALYTSPHLERVNERMRVSSENTGDAEIGAEIGDDEFARRYFAVHDAGQALVLDGRLAQMPSFFETLTAMAFLHFADAGVEVAVLEVGMGGRLDATNIVDPLVSVITDISLDHTEWLGETIAEIAREKAGILRPNGTMITLPQHPEANQALGEVAVELDVRGVNAAEFMPGLVAGESYKIEVLGKEIAVESPLHGPHQRRNVALAIAAAAELATRHGFAITPEAIEAGIRATRWPGRFERIKSGPTQWLLDVAHNPAGAWALRASLREVNPEPWTLVFSCLKDKPLDELAQILFPLFERVIFAPIASPRATPMEDLLAAAVRTGTAAESAATVKDAIDLARKRVENAAPPQVVVVSGSVYLVGAARAVLLAGQDTE
jgi:dihydrofolate synthase / folylpolyglutamate synthase